MFTDDKELQRRTDEFRKDRKFTRSRLYKVAIANGFYLENEVFEHPDNPDKIVMDLTLCRDGFPIKRRWMSYLAPKDTPTEEIYEVMAFSIVEGLCCVDDYWELLWDLVCDDEIVEQCPCCGMPTIGELVQEDKNKDGYNGMTLLQ